MQACTKLWPTGSGVCPTMIVTRELVEGTKLMLHVKQGDVHGVFSSMRIAPISVSGR
jgi:hypothetical protein